MTVYWCLKWLKCPSLLWWSGMLISKPKCLILSIDRWVRHRKRVNMSVFVCVCVLFVRSWNGFGGTYGRRGCRDVGWSWEIQQISDKTKTVIDDASSISAQKKKQNKTNETERREGKTGGEEDSERQRLKNERKRQSRSHHQTNTRAGLPFLTDSNGKEEEK